MENPFQSQIDYFNRQREPQSEEEWDLFNRLIDEFWVELKSSVHKSLKTLPSSDLEQALLARLQEKASVYGVAPTTSKEG